jgi:predicted outer membrane protein
MRPVVSAFIAVVAAAVPLAGGAQPRTPAPESTASAQASRANTRQIEFLLNALRTSLADVRMGELAAQRGGDQRVRDYGAKLKNDFTKQAAEIERLLEPLNVPIPTEPSAEAEAHLAALARLTGKEFDMAFVQQLIWTHTDAIESYGAQTQASPNRSVHDFAATSLPLLREHLAKTEALR